MSSRLRNRGFTLIEVLVALVLLSIGLLGLAKLQFWGVKHTGSAYFRTQATQLANEMVERMRSNPAAVADGKYQWQEADDEKCDDENYKKEREDLPDCRTTSCTPDQMATYDLFAVACGLNKNKGEEGVSGLLPQGTLRVSCKNTGLASCIVKIHWQESDDVDAKVEAKGSFVQMTVVP